MVHRVVHILVLVVFLAGVGLGFLSLIRPLLDGGQDRELFRRRAGILCLVGAGGALGLDWLFHHL